MTALETAKKPPTSPASRPAGDRLHDQRGKAIVWILAVLVLAGVAFAVYWFAFRGGGGGGASTALAARVVPASAETVAGIDAGALLASAEFAELAKKQGIDMDAVKAKLADAGVKPEDLKSMVIAADVPDAGSPEVVFAVQTTADAKAAQGAALALKAMLPDGMGDKIDLSNVEAFDGGLVMAGSGPFYDEAAKLARGQGSGGLSAGLAEVRDAIDSGAPIWFATTLPKELAEGGLPGPARQILGGGKPTHAGMSIRIGSKIEFKAALRLEGADAAKVVDQLDSFLSMAGMMAKGEQGELLKALELGSKGSTITVSISLTAEQAKKLAESRGMPF